MKDPIELLMVFIGWAVLAGGLLMAMWALFGDRSRGVRRCWRCWYILEGLESSRCPECAQPLRVMRKQFRTRRRWRWALLALVLMLGGWTGRAYPQLRDGGWVRAIPTSVLVLALPVIEDHWEDGDWRSVAIQELVEQRVGDCYDGLEPNGPLADWQWRRIIVRGCSQVRFHPNPPPGGVYFEGPVRAYSRLIESAICQGAVHRIGEVDRLASRFPVSIRECEHPSVWPVGIPIPISIWAWHPFASFSQFRVEMRAVGTDSWIDVPSANNPESGGCGTFAPQFRGYAPAPVPEGTYELEFRVRARLPVTRSGPRVTEPLLFGDSMFLSSVRIEGDLTDRMNPTQDPGLDDRIRGSLESEVFSEEQGQITISISTPGLNREDPAVMGDIGSVELIHGEQVVMRNDQIIRGPGRTRGNWNSWLFNIYDFDGVMARAAPDDGRWSVRFFVDPSRLLHHRKGVSYWPGEVVVPVDWSNVFGK